MSPSMSPITFRKVLGKHGGVATGPPKKKGEGMFTQMRRRMSGHEDQLVRQLTGLASSSSDNPMFYVKAPSFSSSTGRADRKSIRRRPSGRESRVSRVTELLMDEGIDVTDRRSVHRNERRAERKATMDTQEVKNSHRPSDASSRMSTKRSNKLKKEQRSRTTGRMERSTTASTSTELEANKLERRRSMYEPRSKEMDEAEWVKRMAGVMELRKKHRSFRRSGFEEMPNVDTSVDSER